jgi:hypothetical protein
MTFDDYQACLNALFAADRQLNLVQARSLNLSQFVEGRKWCL